MAIIGIRDLVHSSKDVLERVEQHNEPFLITRRGQPVAALVPVDAAEAERYAIASAPALLASRERAERAPGRTRPLAEVAEQYGIEPIEPGSGDALSGQVEIVSSLRPFVGTQMAERYAGEAGERLESITHKVLKTVEDWGLFAELGSTSDRATVTTRVRALNQQLFGVEVRTLLKTAAGERLEGLGSTASSDEQSEDAGEGVFGSSLADEALEQAVQRVDVTNQRIFTLASQNPSAFSIAAYELSVRTGIEMLGGRMMLSDHADPATGDSDYSVVDPFSEAGR
ncbi:MAG TPA: type II toxin-antitoxin system Phd/YefM family antitoxin [Solirubrobacteraceae bacterium]|nr:type II toxin-antitoxin system Phd/YefM family antitoxin [Solirubrobacteraceae bacterium]